MMVRCIVLCAEDCADTSQIGDGDGSGSGDGYGYGYGSGYGSG